MVTLMLIMLVSWGVHHVIAIIGLAMGKPASPMAFTFLICFLFLWWIPLSWMEKPFKVDDKQAAELATKTLTVHIPVYNEDPATLRIVLESLLAQTRLPNRVHVVDDGSPDDYAEIKEWFQRAAADKGIFVIWRRTVNRGKRWAQMETLATDDADFYCTLDSDSTLDVKAIEEGLKPFADPEVTSVAGMIVVWNDRANFLTRLTCTLYTPFTRSYRAAQSQLGRVMVNSGTLAFYRASVVRKYAGVYERESFMGKPMQMNDDSMLTFYGMLEGKTVHQPSSITFTIVPEKFKHYANQQLRWMRGTFIRTLWWWRYLSPKDFAWWMPLIDFIQWPIAVFILPMLYIKMPGETNWGQMALTAFLISMALNYLICLRYFVIQRSDETFKQMLAIFALAPITGWWRVIVLRPLGLYAMLTFWKINKWGTRESVEVKM